MASNDDFKNHLSVTVDRYDKNLQLKDLQEECLRYVYDKVPGNCDAILSLPTGFGKSVIFHILAPLLRLKFGRDDGSVIVVCPLNLIQADQLQHLKSRGIKSCRLSVACQASSLSEDSTVACVGEPEQSIIVEKDISLESVQEGKFHIIFCHPEALFCTMQGQKLLDNTTFQHNVLGVVVDECHTVETWSKKFRTAFKDLSSLTTFFPGVPLLAMSGTLTSNQLKEIPKLLGMSNVHIISQNPDRPNIFLEVVKKNVSDDISSVYEDLIIPECERLHVERERFPVTLMYLPLEWNSFAQLMCKSLFCSTGNIEVHESLFSSIYSTQAPEVIEITLVEMKKKNPRIRLVFCSPAVGMGFDPPSVERVIHVRPPRNMIDYVQQIGRAGRAGQKSKAILYYSNRDIAKNLPGIQQNIIEYCQSSTCLRLQLLRTFGYDEPAKKLAMCECCSVCSPFCTCDNCEI